MDEKDRKAQKDASEGSASHGVGEAAGGISGVVTGAAIGSAGGPVGTVIGSIAGAIGGWWAGHKVSEAVTQFNKSEDEYYRERYESSSERLADRSYEDVRPAYQLGHLASMNPDYTGKNFESIEADLKRGWGNNLRAKHGDWTQIRQYAQDAYNRRMSVPAREAANQVDDSRENLSDPVGPEVPRAGPLATGAEGVYTGAEGTVAGDPSDRRS